MSTISEALKEKSILNNIVPDLLPIIDEYLKTFPVFAIGYKSHDDYRIVNKHDFKNEKFFTSFVKYYQTNNGLLSLDTFKGKVLCVGDYACMIDYLYVRCNPNGFSKCVDIESGKIIPFWTMNIKSEHLWDRYDLRFEKFNSLYSIKLLVKADQEF